LGIFFFAPEHGAIGALLGVLMFVDAVKGSAFFLMLPFWEWNDDWILF
jgi:hypothetical protein